MATPPVTGAELAAGQVLVGGFEGTRLPERTADRLRSGRLGGLVLMGRNVESPQQVAGLLAEAARSMAAGLPPPLLAVDQEGGRVARLRRDVIQLPPARAFGVAADLGLTRRAHAELGRQLHSLGFTVDFAPVLDVDGGPAGAIVGDRSFDGDPTEAARHGRAATAGLLEAGICPCGKHFPGHGCTRRDSHEELPRVDLDAEALAARELPPFEEAIAAGLPMVMTAHVVYEALDPGRPATCSPAVVRDLLRGRLGFDGVVVTDDMTMGAVTEVGGPPEVAVEALGAGVDLVLVCHHEDLQEQVREAIAAAARRSRALAHRLDEAAARSRALRERFVPAPRAPESLREILGSEEAARLRRKLDGLVVE